MTRRHASFATLVLLGSLAIASCGSDKKSSDTTGAPVTTAAATATTTAAAPASAPTTAAGASSSAPASGDLSSAATVDIKEFKFGPSEVHVAVGGTVTWTNSDNQKHTATASGMFDTKAIEAGASGTATFDAAGTYAYICSFHPFMKGTVVVGS